MKTFDISLGPEFDQLLSLRERDLCAVLDAHEKLRSGQAARQDEVRDFKDLANAESLAAVSEAEAEHAAIELEEVLAARRRLHDHSYGRCLRCEQAIDLRRLAAMPATAFCTPCQALHEGTRPSSVTH